jgi:GntR family transcriptional regulator
MWISIDAQNSRPIYLQIIYQIKQQIRQGTLKPGDELPSVRELAQILGVNMHTTRGAYLKLEKQKIINLRPGRRAVINRFILSDSKKIQEDLKEHFQELVTDALLAGLSEANIRQIVDSELEQIQDKGGNQSKK